PPADNPAVPEQFLDLMRVRRRADVEVFRPPAQKQVADAAADEVGDVIGLAEPVEHFEGVGIDVAARERVLGARNDPRLSHRQALYQLSLGYPLASFQFRPMPTSTSRGTFKTAADCIRSRTISANASAP